MPTDALKYGKRVLVVGLECFHAVAHAGGAGPGGAPVLRQWIPTISPLKSAARAREVARLMYKLGIDVGGTNTDAVLIDENLKVVAAVKNPTSGDIYEGIMGAVDAVLAAGRAWTASRSGRPCWAPPSARTPSWSARDLAPIGYPAHRRTRYCGHSAHGRLGRRYCRGCRGHRHYRRRL